MSKKLKLLIITKTRNEYDYIRGQLSTLSNAFVQIEYMPVESVERLRGLDFTKVAVLVTQGCLDNDVHPRHFDFLQYLAEYAKSRLGARLKNG